MYGIAASLLVALEWYCMRFTVMALLGLAHVAVAVVLMIRFDWPALAEPTRSCISVSVFCFVR